MAFLEFVIPVKSWKNSEKEILFAKMEKIGFEGFVEGDDDILAYIKEEEFATETFNQLIDELAGLRIRVQYRFHKSEDQNWNEEWERKFEPVVIDGTTMKNVLRRCGGSTSAPSTTMLKAMIASATTITKPANSFGAVAAPK